jgi:hypothetical protein
VFRRSLFINSFPLESAARSRLAHFPPPENHSNDGARILHLG